MTNPDHTVVIGVDGGGTGCRAAVGTSDAGILGRAEGGPANASTDPGLAVRNVIATVEAATAAAGICPSDLARGIAHIGLAGVQTAQDSAQIADALPYATCTVTDDRPGAVAGALGAQDGFVLSVGTGTIAGARLGGTVRFVSGWGFQFSDQSSGAWLGRSTMKQVLLCHDGLAPHTALTRAVFAQYGNDPNAVVAFGLTATPKDMAAPARLILQHAADGDAFGVDLLNTGAAFLVRCLDVLGFRPGDTLCLTGGVGPSYAPFLLPKIRAGLSDPVMSSVDGAFHLANANDPRARA